MAAKEGWMVMRLNESVKVGPFEEVPMGRGVLGVIAVWETEELARENAYDEVNDVQYEVVKIRLGKDEA